MAAGIATLNALTPRTFTTRSSAQTDRLVHGLRGIAADHRVPFTADSAGSMWGFFFRAEPVRSFADAKTSDVERFKRFFHAALERGVYLAPSAFEAAFMSSAHTDADVDETLNRLTTPWRWRRWHDRPRRRSSPRRSVASAASAERAATADNRIAPATNAGDATIRVLLSARAPAARDRVARRVRRSRSAAAALMARGRREARVADRA